MYLSFTCLVLQVETEAGTQARVSVGKPAPRHHRLRAGESLADLVICKSPAARLLVLHREVELPEIIAPQQEACPHFVDRIQLNDARELAWRKVAQIACRARGYSVVFKVSAAHAVCSISSLRRRLSQRDMVAAARRSNVCARRPCSMSMTRCRRTSRITRYAMRSIVACI